MCCSYSKEQLKPNSYLVTYFHQLLLHTLISSACSQQGSPVLPNWPGQEWTRSWSIETQRCRVPQTTSRSTPEPDHGPRPSTGGGAKDMMPRRAQQTTQNSHLTILMSMCNFIWTLPLGRPRCDCRSNQDSSPFRGRSFRPTKVLPRKSFPPLRSFR